MRRMRHAQNFIDPWKAYTYGHVPMYNDYAQWWRVARQWKGVLEQYWWLILRAVIIGTIQNVTLVAEKKTRMQREYEKRDTQSIDSWWVHEHATLTHVSIFHTIMSFGLRLLLMWNARKHREFECRIFRIHWIHALSKMTTFGYSETVIWLRSLLFTQCLSIVDGKYCKKSSSANRFVWKCFTFLKWVFLHYCSITSLQI